MKDRMIMVPAWLVHEAVDITRAFREGEISDLLRQYLVYEHTSEQKPYVNHCQCPPGNCRC